MRLTVSSCVVITASAVSECCWAKVTPNTSPASWNPMICRRPSESIMLVRTRPETIPNTLLAASPAENRACPRLIETGCPDDRIKVARSAVSVSKSHASALWLAERALDGKDSRTVASEPMIVSR
jgi:hypothetical protein